LNADRAPQLKAGVELNRFAVDCKPDESDVIQFFNTSLNSFLSASLF
jgi:hypothetical protein